MVYLEPRLDLIKSAGDEASIDGFDDEILELARMGNTQRSMHVPIREGLAIPRQGQKRQLSKLLHLLRRNRFDCSSTKQLQVVIVRSVRKQLQQVRRRPKLTIRLRGGSYQLSNTRDVEELAEEICTWSGDGLVDQLGGCGAPGFGGARHEQQRLEARCG